MTGPHPTVEGNGYEYRHQNMDKKDGTVTEESREEGRRVSIGKWFYFRVVIMGLRVEVVELVKGPVGTK